MARKDVTDVMVVKAYLARNPFDDIWVYDILMEWTGEPLKVCYRAMERANDRGYIECGVSLRSGWVTEEGKKLIE